MKGILKVLKVVLPIGLAVYLMWYTFKDPEQRNALFESIKAAKYQWVAISVVCAVVSHMIRARRWKYLLHPLGYKTRFWNAYHAVMIGYFANMVIPRAGEVSRPEYFRRYEKIPFDKTFGTIAAERVVDLMAFALIAGIAVLTQFDILWAAMQEATAAAQGGESSASNWKWIAVVAVLVIGILVVKKFGLVEKVKGFLMGILEGVKTIWTTEYKWPFFRDTLLIWGLYLIMFAVCYQCFEESSGLGIGAVLSGFVFGTLAVIFTPGGTGAYHLAVAFALSFYGVEDNIGQALGLILWGSQMVLYILLGSLSLLLMPPYNKDYQGHVSTTG